MRKQKDSPDIWVKTVVFGLPILTFLGGIVVNSWGIANKLATVPYVDERFEASIKHTNTSVGEAIKHSDEKAEEVRKDAFTHSNENRQAMTLEMQRINADMRESMARVSTTLDLVLHKVQQISESDSRYSSKRSEK